MAVIVNMFDHSVTKVEQEKLHDKNLLNDVDYKTITNLFVRYMAVQLELIRQNQYEHIPNYMLSIGLDFMCDMIGSKPEEVSYYVKEFGKIIRELEEKSESIYDKEQVKRFYSF